MNASSSTSPARQRTDRLDIGRQSGNLRLPERIAALGARLEARADTRAAAGLQVHVREARAHVRDWNPSGVSSATSDRYAHVVSQMRAAGGRPEDAACKSTFEYKRAALVHQTRSELKTSLTELDRAKREGDVNRAADAYNRIQNGLETLRKYPPSTGSREQDLQRRSAYPGPVQAAADRSNGKRASLVDLPDNWRDSLQAEVRDYDRPAVAAMALTGCRPAEVSGIKVRQRDENITFEIRGAKVDADRGVKSRTISIEKSELEQSQAGQDLQDWLGNRECRTVSHRGDVAAFRERVARAADRADLGQVSSYTFRHSEARELRNSGESREEIANRLGHRSERSQSTYG